MVKERGVDLFPLRSTCRFSRNHPPLWPCAAQLHHAPHLLPLCL